MPLSPVIPKCCNTRLCGQPDLEWLRPIPWQHAPARAGGMLARRWAAVGGAALFAALVAGQVRAQTTAAQAQRTVAAAFTPSEPAFPKLFPKYTGMNGYEDLVTAGDIVGASEKVNAAEQGGATLKQMRSECGARARDAALRPRQANTVSPRS